jgi:hypothetical protein
VGGGGKGGNTTTSSFKPPEAFMKAYQESLDMARDAVNRPYEQYKGDLVAGLTPTQQQGIANINAAQGMALPAIQKGMGYTEQAAKGITPGLYNRFYSPYVKDVANTTFSNLMESQAQQQSGLKSGAIQAGAFGGDRGGVAQAEMARQQQLGNAMAMSNIYNQGYGQAMGLAGQQVANLGAMGQQMAALGAGAQGSVLQGAQAQMAAGAQEQATKQAELQAAYQQWMQKQAYPYQNAQFFANIAQGLGAGAGGTSSTTAPAPNIWSQIFGGIGAIGSIYSDKRMKENIEAVGTLNDGQTVYRYNFKGDPKTQIGLLAQEVEEQKPNAVTQVKGLKMVDYKGATDDAAKMSSMGGVVGPAMNRQGLAGGGVSYYPYGDAESYVPEGKIEGRQDTIGYRAPKPQTDSGLSEDWKDISPISSSQASGLRALAKDVGLDLPKSKEAEKYDEENTSDNPLRAGVLAVREKFFPSQAASGGVVGRKHYQDGGMEDVPTNEGLASVPAPTTAAEPEFKYPTNEEVEAYIAQEAARRNIDPEVAVRVWRSEGASGDPREAWQSKVINKRGERERSYGPYQLYMEGGLGNEMVGKTGLSPEDPRNWKPSVGFALDQAATGGWGPWHGAKAIGLDEKAGLANARPIGDYSGTRSGVGATVAPVTSDAEGLAAVPAPETETSGLVIKGEKPRSKLDLSKIFASEENPSLIEKIMGRRLSPEARSAVMNASFALMAGRSPFFFTNLGEAGKVGTQTYYNALAQRANMAGKQAEIQKTLTESQLRQFEIQKANAEFYGPILQDAMLRNNGILPENMRHLVEKMGPFAEAYISSVSKPIAPPSLGEVSSSSTTAPVTAAPPAPTAKRTESAGVESITPPIEGGGVASTANTGEQNVPFADLLSDPAYLSGIVNNSNLPYATRMAAKAKLESANEKLADNNGIYIGRDGKPHVYAGWQELIAQQEGLKTAASEKAKAGYDLVDVVNPATNQKVKIPRSEAIKNPNISELSPLQVKGIETLSKQQAEGAEILPQLQTYRNQLIQLARLMEHYRTGMGQQEVGAAIKAARALGIDTSGLDASSSPEDMEKFIKGQYTAVFNQIKSIGSRFTNLEMSNMIKANPNPSLEPEANASILAQLIGAANHDLARQEAFNEWIAQNPNASNIGEFLTEFYADPNNSPLEFQKRAAKDIAYIGMDVPRTSDGSINANKLIVGKRYVLQNKKTGEYSPWVFDGSKLVPANVDVVTP